MGPGLRFVRSHRLGHACSPRCTQTGCRWPCGLLHRTCRCFQSTLRDLNPARRVRQSTRGAFKSMRRVSPSARRVFSSPRRVPGSARRVPWSTLRVSHPTREVFSSTLAVQKAVLRVSDPKGPRGRVCAAAKNEKGRVAAAPVGGSMAASAFSRPLGWPAGSCRPARGPGAGSAGSDPRPARAAHTGRRWPSAPCSRPWQRP